MIEPLNYFLERNFKHIREGMHPMKAAFLAEKETSEKMAEPMGSCQGHSLPQPEPDEAS
ncbi:MAG: hypothetical protein IH994_05995 [Proteobacteria bacterium]|nr:hypothetical protein [Pseudomonadota bacterium]